MSVVFLFRYIKTVAEHNGGVSVTVVATDFSLLNDLSVFYPINWRNSCYCW